MFSEGAVNIMKFAEMGLNENTMKALTELKYENATEVQEKVIPRIIESKNMIIRSQTGTGKTAAFGIGIIERITSGKSKKALILTPTRELAVQVCKELRAIGKHHKLGIVVVYGGQSINLQMDELERGVDILVATPGRLIDLFQRGAVSIRNFDIGILDEADQMLDMGFQDDVMMILNQLPHQRMTLLVSATVDDSILGIAAKYVPNAETIEIGEIEAASTIKEEHIEITETTKFPALMDVLKSHVGVKTLIFRETKMGVSRIQERLWQRGFRVGALQGDMTQAKRTHTLEEFKNGRINILVATNVAARGLHIEGLGLIINYDKAQSEEVHLHRIGRTGRMGKEGKAINFVQRKETLNERMSDDHPDFAWMRGGGSSSHQGQSRDRRPSHGGHPSSRHSSSPHRTGGHTQGHSGSHGGHSSERSHGSYGHPRERRRPRY